LTKVTIKVRPFLETVIEAHANRISNKKQCANRI
jgi:hypothetical protein